MKMVIGADHRGYDHKEFIKKEIVKSYPRIQWIDVGAFDKQRSDYPIFTHKVCNEIVLGNAQSGILLCGSGIGMSIAANRFQKIYAALVWNEEVARKSREDDNANILVLPADFISLEYSVTIINEWLGAEFKGGRYQDRLAMID